MAVNPISSTNTSINTPASFISQTDSETKSIQNEITTKNQRLNRLTTDAKMSAEEKAKERQEIQKQINELNRKLELLRKEQEEEDKRVQKMQEKKNAAAKKQAEAISSKEDKKIISEKLSDEDLKKDEEAKESFKEQTEKTTMPPQDIQKLLEVGTLIQKDLIIQSTQRQKDAAENVLAAEIKSDKIYGSDTSDKREKLSSMIKQPVPKVQIEEKPEPKQMTSGKISGKVVISDNIL